jgi:hypothetical protein
VASPSVTLRKETSATSPEFNTAGVDGDCGPPSFRRYIVAAAVTGAWIPWAELVDRAHRDLIRSVPPSGDAVKRAQAWAKKERDTWLADEQEILKDQASREIDTWRLHRNIRDEWEQHYALPPEERVPTVEELTKCRLRDLIPTVEDSLQAWRQSREAVLSELGSLGLTGTVIRTDRSDSLESHEADLAGLVQLHLPWQDTLPDRCAPRTDYERRVYETHGLTPCDGIPKGLRAFCGQIEPDPRRKMPIDIVIGPLGRPELPERDSEGAPILAVKLSWMDHTRTWLDAEGLPVLTTEPYQLDPLAVVRELGELPLSTEVHPGLWNDHTTLLIMRWDCDVEPLPAEAKTLVARPDYETREWVRVYV